MFYGFYFAATIPLTAVFHPFDTPAMYDWNGRAWVRLFASFFILNVLPLAYFVIVFDWLSKLSKFTVSFRSMFLLLLLSLAGFGFYRVYFGLMLLQAGGQYVFYGSQLPQRLSDELQQRGGRQREVLPHVIPGVVWIAISFGAGWFLIRSG